MKKILLYLFVFIFLFALFSCKPAVEIETPQNSKPALTEEIVPTQMPQPTSEPTPVPTGTPIPYNAEAFKDNGDGTTTMIDLNPEDPNILNSDIARDVSDNTKIEIPLYTPEYITYGSRGGFIPTIDHGMWLTYNVYSDYLMYILTAYPSNAWRKMDYDRYYVMYDITNGTRIYVFFNSMDNGARVMGYPVLMDKALSYADFSEVKIGDDISKISAIDTSVQYTTNNWNQASEAAIKYYYEAGNPICSVHLLTDGILKYTYERSGEEGNYVYTIVDIEYHEDFKMEGLGGVTDYSIAEIDYVD